MVKEGNTCALGVLASPSRMRARLIPRALCRHAIARTPSLEFKLCRLSTKLDADADDFANLEESMDFEDLDQPMPPRLSKAHFFALGGSNKFARSRSAEDVLRTLEAMQAQDVHLDFLTASTALHRLGMGNPSRKVAMDTRVLHLLDATCDEQSRVHARGISNASWGMAKLGVSKDHRLWSVLQEHAQEHSDEFDAGTLSELMWSLATARIQPEPVLLALMARVAIMKMDSFDPTELVNLTWAFSRFGLSDQPTLVDAIVVGVETKIGLYTPRNIATFLFSLAKGGQLPNQRLIAALLEEAVAKHDRLSFVDTATILWALATMKAAVTESALRVLAAAAARRAQPGDTCRSFSLLYLRQVRVHAHTHTSTARSAQSPRTLSCVCVCVCMYSFLASHATQHTTPTHYTH